jgi:hypothetical protein
MRNRTGNDRKGRVLATIGATIVAVTAFATVGGVGLAHGVINLAQYQYGKKITICHKNKETITISINAWPAHQRHGDTIGRCQATSTGTNGSQSSGTSNGRKGRRGNKGGKKSGRSDNSTGTTAQPNGNGNGHGHGKSH